MKIATPLLTIAAAVLSAALPPALATDDPYLQKRAAMVRDQIEREGVSDPRVLAVAAKLAAEVYSVEILESLASRGRQTLSDLGYRNVVVRQGDGYYGWEEKGPFDAIIVTCAGGHIPPPLLRQLRNGGRMIMPVGGPFMTQNLVYIEKDARGSITHRNVLPVAFVRLLGH